MPLGCAVSCVPGFGWPGSSGGAGAVPPSGCVGGRPRRQSALTRQGSELSMWRHDRGWDLAEVCLPGGSTCSPADPGFHPALLTGRSPVHWDFCYVACFMSEVEHDSFTIFLFFFLNLSIVVFLFLPCYWLSLILYGWCWSCSPLFCTPRVLCTPSLGSLPEPALCPAARPQQVFGRRGQRRGAAVGSEAGGAGRPKATVKPQPHVWLAVGT